MQFNSEVKKEVAKIGEDANNILKKCIDNPEKVFDFIEKQNTLIIKMPIANKILFFINQQEGFITPQSGINALYLTFVINILSKKKVPLSLKTNEMFVMRNLPPNIYFLAHQFHLWYAFKKGLPGYDAKTQAKFKKIWKYEEEETIKNLSVDEIIALKDAISRDVQAIDFVKKFARDNVGTKQASDNLKNGKSVDL
ncbi:MAG: hypothetical protein PHV68_02540 [Candidatus Gastranaerophilales bacterium]|nr:hypothetical protein [Candidatus Gastranaerophilales bacterium]